MRKAVCYASLTMLFIGASSAYADIAPPPQEGILLERSLLVALPLLALIAGSYLWSRRRVA